MKFGRILFDIDIFSVPFCANDDCRNIAQNSSTDPVNEFRADSAYAKREQVVVCGGVLDF